jgi:hypothetical protein
MLLCIFMPSHRIKEGVKMAKSKVEELTRSAERSGSDNTRY